MRRNENFYILFFSVIKVKMLMNTIVGQQNHRSHSFSFFIIPVILTYIGFCEGKYSDLKMHIEDKTLEYINGNNTWFTYTVF